MSRTQKLTGIFTISMAFISLPVYAQVKDGNIVLPKVATGKTAYCKVFSVWKPAKKFLKHNPDFLKDGSYAMSDAYIKKGRERKYRYKRVVQNGLIIPENTSFTSADYPAVYVPSDKKINTGGNVYIQVLRGMNSESKFPLGKGPHAHRRNNTGYFSSYAEAANDPGLKNSYVNLNNYYKQKTKEITAQKFANPVYISDIGSSRTEAAEYGLNDLFLEFEFVDVQSVTEHYLASDMFLYFPVPGLMFMMPWNYALITTRRNSGTGYPSNLLLQLHVKNATGKEIKTYKQAVFVRERHLVGWAAGQNYSVSALGMILKQAMPAAMENLISQFAEDTAVIKKINDNNQKTIAFASQYPSLNRWLSLQKKLNEINDTKTSLETSINKLGAEIEWGFNVPTGYNGDPGSGFSNVTIPSNASAGAVAGAAVGIIIIDIATHAIVNSINKSQADKKTIAAQKSYNNLSEQYRQLIREEAETRKEASKMGSDAVEDMMKVLNLKTPNP